MADDREIPSVPGLFASGSASPSDMFGESGPQRTHGLVAGDLLPVKGDRDCRVEQLVLLGQPRPIRIPEQRWPSWLEDPVVAARLEAKRDKQPTRLCWPWIGGPSTGHGSFRAASLPGPSRRGCLGSPVRLPTGLRGILQLGWSGPDDAAICHRCDFAGCTNPAHMRLGTNATDRAEYLARHSDPAGPLADVRGAAGRTRAIAAAIRAG